VWASDLAPEHVQLVPENEDLDLLRPIATTAQNEQLEQAANRPVKKGQDRQQQGPSTHPSTVRPWRVSDRLLGLQQRSASPSPAARQFLGPTGSLRTLPLASYGRSHLEPHAAHAHLKGIYREAYGSELGE
jgi:hypothetical protein